jgi:exodeoxyribonuclease V alpha subunit
MNGTTGHVISTKPLVINFDGEAVKIESDYKNQQVLAYAATVHKLQGSEVPVVIYICHKSQSFMHHRNLFYTAVTRAKRAAIIIGDAWAIRHCATTVETARRKTIMAALCAKEGKLTT